MAPISTKRRKLSHSPNASGDDSECERPSAPNESTQSRRLNGVDIATGQEREAHHAPTFSQASTDDLLLSQSSHKSSLFKLQLDELLKAVRPDIARQTSLLQKPLFRLKEIIESISETQPESFMDAEKRLRKSGIAVPFPSPRPTKDAKNKVQCLAPADINVTGCLALKIGARGGNSLNTVDLTVTLPPQSFQEKDYLNHRYFHKRAVFIATFASAIKTAADKEFEIHFDMQDGLELLPCLVVRPGKAAAEDFRKSKAQIRVITSIPESFFPLDKTNICKNCVRPKEPMESKRNDLEPTPFYNSSLNWDASVTPYLAYLLKALKTCDGLRDAVTLGTTWLRQRGYNSSVSAGGFGTFEWTVLCALLLEGGGVKGRPVLSPRYNSYQIFKGVLQFLVGRDLRDPLAIGSHSAKIPNSTSPVLYDARRGVNVFFKVSAWTYDLLRFDAKATLEELNQKLFDNFESSFITKTDSPLLRYDYIARLELDVSDISTERETLDSLHQILVRGFGNRAQLIHLSMPENMLWNVNKSYMRTREASIEIGIVFDPDNANRSVDKGPMAEEKEEAENFRNFWGGKAELRRFRDGTISETLVWSEADPSSIPHQIISTLVTRHFGLLPSALTSIGDNATQAGGIGPAQNSFQGMIETFQSLSSKLHALEGVPLAIRSLSATDEQLRFSSLKQPLEGFKPANIVVQFEGSSRWPDALSAIQRTKIAFLIRIGDLLEADAEPLRTQVGLENTHSAILNLAFLDVFFTTGVVFRLRIHHEREQFLLDRELRNKDLPGRSRDEYSQALSAYKRQYIHGPRHTQAIRLLCTRFPALSETIRLFKRWICSHLLSSFFQGELLELLCAQVFLRPQPWGSPPSTAFTAFLRVLTLVSKWDWAAEPFIVDTSSGEEMTSADLATINTNFQAWRKIDPAMNNVALFLASNLDPSGVIWTQGPQPPLVVASRFTSLAIAAATSIRDQNLDLDFPSLFHSPLTHFNFLLHLKPSIARPNRSKSNNSTSKFKNLSLDLDLVDPTGFPAPTSNPITLYLNDLRTAFNESTVLFFHNSDDDDDQDDRSNVIAGLWNPRNAAEGVEKAFRVRMGVSVMPAQREVEEVANEEDNDEEKEAEGKEKTVEKVVVNREGMLAEMAMLGKGIVERVEVLGG